MPADDWLQRCHIRACAHAQALSHELVGGGERASTSLAVESAPLSDFTTALPCAVCVSHIRFVRIADEFKDQWRNNNTIATQQVCPLWRTINEWPSNLHITTEYCIRLRAQVCAGAWVLGTNSTRSTLLHPSCTSPLNTQIEPPPLAPQLLPIFPSPCFLFFAQERRVQGRVQVRVSIAVATKHPVSPFFLLPCRHGPRPEERVLWLATFAARLCPPVPEKLHLQPLWQGTRGRRCWRYSLLRR